MTLIPDALLDGDQASWLGTLSAHQRRTVELYLSKGKSPEEIAELWLSARPENTYGFGAEIGKSIFLTKVQGEIRSFLCGGTAYDNERSKLLEHGEVTRAMLVASVTSAISPAVGASAVFLAPIVVLTLFLTAKIGLRAWCAAGGEQGEAPPPSK